MFENERRDEVSLKAGSVSGPVKSWQTCWMLAAVSLIGVLSVAMLLGSGWLSERQRINSARADAIRDVQILASIAHLWIEEAISGDSEEDVRKALGDMDRAIEIVGLIIQGGNYGHGRVLEPMDELELMSSAGELKSLLIRSKQVGIERLQHMKESGSGSQLDRQFDTIFREALEKAKTLEYIVEADQAKKWAMSKRVFKGIFYSLTFIVTVAMVGLWSRERRRQGAEKALLQANEQLMSQTDELKEHRERLSGMVEMRTMELSAVNQSLREENAERRRTEETLKETEKQMRQLSSKLLNAQEIERKRISMGLHDELGQALNVMKLQMRVLEKGLREDQTAIKNGCEKLLEYIDQVIEDVRRLSLDLSPTVLEDLGLTSALHWLISTFAKNPEMKVKGEIDEIDQLVPENCWIIVYRVIQEALTNVGRHSQAANVSVVIKRQGDMLTFVVEDDGKGFDLKQAGIKNSTEKGLGLSTMNERVRMIGGDFEIRSQEGKGTRIYFSIPVGKGAILNGSL